MAGGALADTNDECDSRSYRDACRAGVERSSNGAPVGSESESLREAL